MPGYNRRVIADVIVAAIRARLTAALAPPAGPFLPLRVPAGVVGWLDEGRARRLTAFRDVFEARDGALGFVSALASLEARTRAMHDVARVLAADGQLTAWRDERYAVAPAFGASPSFLLERAAARYFGIRTYAAHANGLALHSGGTTMWIARRSPHKSVDPGLLDNLVGGGIAAGASVRDTLVKDAWEEAGIPAPLARTARPAGAVHVCRALPDGLQRETIFVHDLALPADFAPAGQDGEVVEHRSVALAEAARLVTNATGRDVVTADAGLVIVDFLLRRGAVAADVADYLALDALRHPRLDPVEGTRVAPAHFTPSSEIDP
jgi:8-oxo-dGTP pyrophosphatase MutT (NUDIX family)